MVKQAIISVFMILFLAVSCKKEAESEVSPLPSGAVPYTTTELTFVPYSSGNRIFKKAPSFVEELVLNFKERTSSETFYAWDQTYFSFETDPGLEIEFRLRYTHTGSLQQKSLAVYMPYRDDFDEAQSSLFELPISSEGIETGFFSELILFHDTLELYDNQWLNVFEVLPLSGTNGGVDGASNFSRIYYNATYGLIGMDQKNGNKWLLNP